MIELLKEVKLCEGLLPDELEKIQNLCEVRQVTKDTQVFQAGQTADYLFLVVAGEIELRFKVVYYNASSFMPVLQGKVCVRPFILA